MADSEDQVTSTTSLLNDEVHHYEPELEQPKADHFSVDDIVDLVGGAQDALERHIAEDTSAHEVSETLVEEHPVTLVEPEPEPIAETATSVPEPEPVLEPEPAAVEEEEAVLPDSTTPAIVPQAAADLEEEPIVVAPKAEPEITSFVEPEVVPEPVVVVPEPVVVVPEPVVVEEPVVVVPAPAPVPVPVSDALPVPAAAEPRKEEAPAPAEAAEQPAVTEEPPAPASYAPSPPKAQPQPLMQFPTEHWDSPFLTSQDNSKKNPMDPFSKESAPIGSSNKYESDLLQGSDDDDDLMYEVKKNNNPFDGFSPLADSGYSHFGDSKPDSRATKMSESPTPDLVQYGQSGEPLDSPPSFLDEEEIFGSGKKTGDSLMQSLSQFSTSAKEVTSALKDEDEETGDNDVPPRSLPDILKSSPLNPDKADSGSSEGTPEDQSPILERKMMESPNPPINLSNNPFAFDGKVSLLKEMAEEMEVRAAEHAKTVDEKTFGAFDLVKEAAETTPPPAKVKEEEPVKIEQKDWFSGFDSPKKPDKLEPLNLKDKKNVGDDSDSESHTADSLSPVLEAMGKNPASFQVETMKKDVKMEEPEVAEEVSEHEVSSEEFEFIERPPRGVIDEFLEALDTSKFATSKAPEIPMDDDLIFGRKEEAPVPTKAAPSLLLDDDVSTQSSYRLLTQSSPQKSKAELEKLDIQQPAPTKAPVTHSPVQKAEGQPAKKSSLFKMPSLNVKQVVDLLYWRDVKSSGAVFGATLLLLLSLTMCSIVSVCSYIGLALLSVTICFRIYKGILQAIQKSDEGHPFKQFLDKEVALSEDMVHKYSDLALSKINKSIADLRRLFLVEDLVDSIKFAVLMWILTYVGGLFNGLTIVILAVVAAFSCPIIYEKHQEQIDHYLAMVNNQIKDVVGKIQAKVPGMKRKTE